MRVTFIATEAGFEADEFALICGVAGQEQYLTFQRDPEGSAEDWGVHIEYGDQSNGGYNCIAACQLARHEMVVDLGRNLGKLSGVNGFDVILELDDESFRSLWAGLQQIFRGCDETLQMDKE
jgi:hypothetical protein